MWVPVITIIIGLLLRWKFNKNALDRIILTISFVAFGIVALGVGIIWGKPIMIVESVFLWIFAAFWYILDKRESKKLSESEQFKEDEHELSRDELIQMQKDGNKQVVSEVCEHCKTINYKLIPENVVAGTMEDCEKCGELMFFSSPNSPFKEGEKKKGFEKLIKDNIIS